jgi:hypothetical protein
MKHSSANPVKTLDGIKSYTTSQDQFAAEHYIRYNSDTTVNNEFRKAVHFYRAHKMSLHPQKTKFKLFTNSNTASNTDCNIVINCNNDGENFPVLIFSIERIT